MTEQSRVSTRSNKLGPISNIIAMGEASGERSRLGERSKRQIEQWLTQQATLLLDKKERQAQKQQRLKEMEEQFEMERAKKLKHIDNKLDASEKNKTKNLQTIQKKLHQVSTRHQSVLAKIQTDVQHSLEKQIDSRKAYDSASSPQDPLRTGSRLSRATDLSSKAHSRQRFTKGEEDMTIDSKIFEINARLEKAKSISKDRVLAAAQRIHGHNTSEIQSAQNKANRQLESQISNYSHKIASKFESVDINLEKIESSMEKKQEEKQKMYSDKIRKYQDNIKYIQDQQLNKEEELNRKFTQNSPGARTWHDERSEVYHRKFLANLSLLEQKKVMRADQIVQKHQQVSIRNKVYRERKETLFQAIKCDPTQS